MIKSIIANGFFRTFSTPRGTAQAIYRLNNYTGLKDYIISIQAILTVYIHNIYRLYRYRKIICMIFDISSMIILFYLLGPWPI